MKKLKAISPDKILMGKPISYDYLFDVINTAMFSGFKPIDLEIRENVENPYCYAYNPNLGVNIYQKSPVIDYVLTIRLRKNG